MQTPELFPAFLKLSGRECLIVGGGRIAEGKMRGLVRAGAKVLLVAPEVTPQIRQAAGAGEITWQQRTFLPSDLEGKFLVILATGSAELHKEIFRRCQAAGILCNAVDEPERCDFYYPAVVRRGPLQFAISTSGHSPFLAQRLRQELEAQFGPEYEDWLKDIGRRRLELFEAEMDPEARRVILKQISSAQAFTEYQNARAASGPTDDQGKVYFVGAGPGDPDLLTQRAWRIINSADVVLHDALVSDEILKLIPGTAVVRNVGKRCGAKSISQEEIHALLIAHTSSGKRVVRLQGGDPLIFGRAGEEISALRDAGIAFEIVPGVTAASVAAASAQIPLTDRRMASQLILLNAHRPEGEFERDLKALPHTGVTLVMYMPGTDYDRLTRAFQEAGWPNDTPCLLVSQASRPAENIIRTELGSLRNIAPVATPALLVVGAVAAMANAEAISVLAQAGCEL